MTVAGHGLTDPPTFDAVVLAGGRARRLGGASKPEVEVGGVALLDHALAAVAGATHVVVVGPPQLARPGIVTVLEDPPDGGPVAGLAAGLDQLPDGGPELVVVLACDVPGAGRVLPALLKAVQDADGARMVGAQGRPQHLVAVYRRAALRSALDALPDVHGAAMHRLVGGLRLVDVPDEHDATADADTWADVERLDASLSDRIEP
ncbi:molybdenum cofactor guanylyltransferase [Cellulomonas sp.]|uniref:molybdenum cofactor guanylyltransferase n=1 Tax=Cellulomonas sp. TaxID=40001 RepID=UPI003BAD2EAD